jgi:hypothetical protein
MMNDFETQVLSELSVLKAQMQQLLGIGQPGRLCALEERVERHEKSVQRMKGMAGTFGGLLTLTQVGIAWFARR